LSPHRQAATPLFSALLLLSLAEGQWRRLWFWQAFTGVCVIPVSVRGVLPGEL
jgi:hypothetical protein